MYKQYAYFLLAGVLVALASFAGGVEYVRLSGHSNIAFGTIVSRDATSITVREAGGANRVIDISNNPAVFQVPQPVVKSAANLGPGMQVQVFLQDGAVQNIQIVSATPTSVPPAPKK